MSASRLCLQEQAARREILLKSSMAKTKHSIAALDKQAGSLAQIANDALALFFDDVSIEGHLRRYRTALRSRGHPPTRWSKNAAMSLHLCKCQAAPEANQKLTRFNYNPVQRIPGTGIAFVGFPRFQHDVNDLGI